MICLPLSTLPLSGPPHAVHQVCRKLGTRSAGNSRRCTIDQRQAVATDGAHSRTDRDHRAAHSWRGSQPGRQLISVTLQRFSGSLLGHIGTH